MQEIKRLHVTPFNPELLPAVLPHKLHQKATDISFHTIESCPENNYGYFNLPLVEADQLRQKLHGYVLRGRKMKVEEAKPRKSSKGQRNDEDISDARSKQTRSRSTKGHEDGSIPAVELPAKRKVKRGWTEADDTATKSKYIPRKDRNKSKGNDSSITGNSECLFKTKLPLNAAQEPADNSLKKRKQSKNQEVVVHEFKNTRQHAGFLKEDNVPKVRPAKEYIDGKGWVDEDEDVVERARKRRKSGNTKIENTDQTKEAIETSKSTPGAEKGHEHGEKDEETSPDATSNSESEATEDASDIDGEGQPSARVDGLGISSIDDSELQTAKVDRLSISRSSASPKPQTQPQPTLVPPGEVHPLEALFKRPKAAASQAQTPRKPQLEVSTSFNFFDNDPAESGGGDASLLMPHTPFTQQDYRHRLIRSAAPTPDTALPGKTFGDVLAGESEEDLASEDEDGQQATAGKQGPARASPEGKMKAEKQPESEFAQWFWEHRGENNRAWKRRRREVAKERKTQDKKGKRA